MKKSAAGKNLEQKIAQFFVPNFLYLKRKIKFRTQQLNMKNKRRRQKFGTKIARFFVPNFLYLKRKIKFRTQQLNMKNKRRSQKFGTKNRAIFSSKFLIFKKNMARLACQAFFFCGLVFSHYCYIFFKY